MQLFSNIAYFKACFEVCKIWLFFKPGVCQPTGQLASDFLKLFLCRRLHVCVFVCPPLRLLITSGVMWCDIDPYDWSNKFYGFYMAAAVGIVSGHGISIHTCCGNQPNKSKLVLFKMCYLRCYFSTTII